MPPTPSTSQLYGEVLTSEKGKSALPHTGSQDFPKKDANKTEKKKTELSDTEREPFPKKRTRKAEKKWNESVPIRCPV